jgi:hypothetical protein
MTFWDWAHDCFGTLALAGVLGTSSVGLKLLSRLRFRADARRSAASVRDSIASVLGVERDRVEVTADIDHDGGRPVITFGVRVDNKPNADAEKLVTALIAAGQELAMRSKGAAAQ